MAAHARAIAQAISASLAFAVPVVVKSAQQWAAIVSECAYAQAVEDHSRVVVASTQEERSLAALGSIEALVTPPGGFVVGTHAACLHCASGILQSKAGAPLLGKAGEGDHAELGDYAQASCAGLQWRRLSMHKDS